MTRLQLATLFRVACSLRVARPRSIDPRVLKALRSQGLVFVCPGRTKRYDAVYATRRGMMVVRKHEGLA